MARLRIATAAALFAALAVLVGCGARSTAAGWREPVGALGAPAASADGTARLVSLSAQARVLTTSGSAGVALTFDDGPDPTYTPRILDLLRRHRVTATFCLVGTNADRYPELVRAIVRDGHTLCNHSWNHDLDLGARSAAEIRSDLRRTNDAIRAAAPGALIRYFRHPGGRWTPLAVSVAQDMGMASAGWDVDTRDWDLAAYPTHDAMTNHIIEAVNAHVRAGSIVLAHDAGGDRTATVAAFEVLLPQLAARFRLVGLPL
jgi:peptidoglycan/xylan/chitin deacetylase (PgdA/CDA1 family)